MSITSTLRSGEHPRHSSPSNAQSLHGIFLPSSPSIEQSIPLHRDSYSHESYKQYPSPSVSSTHYADTKLGGPQASPHLNIYREVELGKEGATPQFMYNFPPQGTTEISTESPYTNGTAPSYNGMSPADTYSSEYEVNGLDDLVVPDFENTFLFEAEFDPLSLPDDQMEVGLLEASATPPLEKQINFIQGSRNTSFTTPPRPLDLTPHSSHLMSPELTDTNSPGSGYGVTTPATRIRLLGGGAMSRLSSQSTATEPNHFLHQRTPALTTSSVEASPEPASGPDNGRTDSPIVRIESYSRGDSPARAVGSMLRSSSKRSRASRSSSHLAAPNDSSSDEDDYGSNSDDRSRTLLGLNLSAISDEHDRISVQRSGLDPIVRSQMTNDVIPNFKDQDEINEQDARKAGVRDWLSKSGTSNESDGVTPGPLGIRKYKTSESRRRARSASNHHSLLIDSLEINSGQLVEADSQVPGPGLLLDEDSGEEEDEDASEAPETPPASKEKVEKEIESAGGYFAHPDREPKPALEASPWADPIYFPSKTGCRDQPATSNAAIAFYWKQAADIETISRRATCGTSVRRLSENDLDRVLGPEGLLSRFSISRDKIMEKIDSHSSSLASRILPKRSTSNMKRKSSEPTWQQSEQTLPANSGRKESLRGRKESLHEKKDSLQDRKESLVSRPENSIVSSSLRRIPSLNKRPKSPSVNTGSTMVAMTSHIASLGGNGSISSTATSPPTGTWNTARTLMRRRSRGDSNRPSMSSAAESGLAALWTKQGGPPLPTLASPPEERDSVAPFGAQADDDEAAETDELRNEHGISMDFTPCKEKITPTKEGFKTNVQVLNPRLAPYLAERLGQEQLRRFKKLIELRIGHIKAIQNGVCSSGKHCVELGGKPSYLGSKAGKKEPELSHTGFSVTGMEKSDLDANALLEGVVTAAQFPPGVPLPPVHRLPAEFECPLCFTIKKIQKPSDWSKHVHEDLQPFTCTFPDCSEPKSFKRKADWVRHENERHRQLEWWNCSMPECLHKCYRRDNFVQHLVREHKFTEPNAKCAKSNKPAVRGPAKSKPRAKGEAENHTTEDDVLDLVASCRHETPKQPKGEPCRFCGNVCNSWKKLTVHLAKHMEQISIPVLDLVRQLDVSPDTIISPIEQNLPSHTPNIPAATENQSVTRSSVSVPPLYDMTMNMSNIKQELPPSFTPLQPTAIFHSPNENQSPGAFQWGQPSGQSSQARAGDSMAYVQGLDNDYPPPYTAYTPPGATPFQVGNSQLDHMHTPPRSSAGAMYTGVRGQVPHMRQAAYPDNQSFPMVMNQLATSSASLEGLFFANQSNFPATQPPELPTHMAIASHLGSRPNAGFPQGQDNLNAIYQDQSQQYYPYPM